MDDLHPDLVLDRVHAADVVEGDARPFDLRFRHAAFSFHADVNAAIDHLAIFRVGADSEPAGELEIGDGWVLLDAGFVLSHGPIDVAGAEEKLGVQDERGGGRVGFFRAGLRRRPMQRCSCSGDSQTSARPTRNAMALGTARCLFIFLLGLVQATEIDQRQSEVLAKGEVVGRVLEGIAKGLQRVHELFRIWDFGFRI